MTRSEIALTFLSDEQLDAREALFIRLLLSLQRAQGSVVQNLHFKLCQVRAEQFARA